MAWKHLSDQGGRQGRKDHLLPTSPEAAGAVPRRQREEEVVKLLPRSCFQWVSVQLPTRGCKGGGRWGLATSSHPCSRMIGILQVQIILQGTRFPVQDWVWPPPVHQDPISGLGTSGVVNIPNSFYTTCLGKWFHVMRSGSIENIWRSHLQLVIWKYWK